MRHKKGIAKLSKPTDQRIAMLRNIVVSLFTYGRIETTEKRAREAKKMAEKVLSIAKEKNVNTVRHALRIIPNKPVVKKVFDEIAVKYKERNGGQVRITKTGIRRGDATQMAMMELIEE